MIFSALKFTVLVSLGFAESLVVEGLKQTDNDRQATLQALMLNSELLKEFVVAEEMVKI